MASRAICSLIVAAAVPGHVAALPLKSWKVEIRHLSLATGSKSISTETLCGEAGGE